MASSSNDSRPKPRQRTQAQKDQDAFERSQGPIFGTNLNILPDGTSLKLRPLVTMDTSEESEVPVPLERQDMFLLDGEDYKGKGKGKANSKSKGKGKKRDVEEAGVVDPMGEYKTTRPYRAYTEEETEKLRTSSTDESVEDEVKAAAIQAAFPETRHGRDYEEIVHKEEDRLYDASCPPLKPEDQAEKDEAEKAVRAWAKVQNKKREAEAKKKEEEARAREAEMAAMPKVVLPDYTERAARTEIDLEGVLPLVARGKVRNLYEVDSKTLLFVATDRISAYDVVMSNGIPNKGGILTLLSSRWNYSLKRKLPHLKTHLITLDLPDKIPPHLRPMLQHRSMQVRKLKVFPIEAIVRGFVAGSAWTEYQLLGTVHGIRLPDGLVENSPIPQGAIFTPSTKAGAGQKDQNIHPEQARWLVGEGYYNRIEKLALEIFAKARNHAAKCGLVLADTKFEFGLDEETDEIVLVDEILTPDSSRYWRGDKYEPGRPQESFDKQFLRDWLTKNRFKGIPDVLMPDDVVRQTENKYREAFERLTRRSYVDAIRGPMKKPRKKRTTEEETVAETPLMPASDMMAMEPGQRTALGYQRALYRQEAGIWPTLNAKMK